MSDLRRQKVTLDELLRLKRAERPSVDFWAGFERELRAKQLAALVGRPAWWSVSWARVRAAMVRVVVPLGATAALVLTALNFNGNGQVVPALVSKPAAVVARTTANAPAVPAAALARLDQTEAVVVAEPASQPAMDFAAFTPAPQSVVAEPTPDNVALAESGPARLTITTPWSGESGRADETLAMAAPAPLSEVDGFAAAAPLPEFTLSQAGLTAEHGFPVKSPGFTSPALYQLVAMSRPSDGAGRLAPVAEAQAREHVRRGLTEDRLFISSRSMVGFEGSAMSMRF